MFNRWDIFAVVDKTETLRQHYAVNTESCLSVCILSLLLCILNYAEYGQCSFCPPVFGIGFFNVIMHSVYFCTYVNVDVLFKKIWIPVSNMSLAKLMLYESTLTFCFVIKLYILLIWMYRFGKMSWRPGLGLCHSEKLQKCTRGTFDCFIGLSRNHDHKSTNWSLLLT